jgi:hypothetical protein
MALKDQLIGKKFNKLTVIERSECSLEKRYKDSYWLCNCDCGSKNIKVSGHNLKGGSVLSCGCIRAEREEERHSKRLEKMEDISGQIFSHLLIIEYAGLNLWKCKCDCKEENIIISSLGDLRSGRIKSCGCFRRHTLPFGEGAFNRLLNTYKTRAIKKNIDFTLTREEFIYLTKQNCFYCGCEPSQHAPGPKRAYGDYIYNGIDRLNNNVGYTKENSMPCCGFCNVAKNNYSKEEFLLKIKAIYNNIINNNLT